uniref:Calmodulin-binding protein n=1 Tax=Kalanchoe fedtschenkoi TaxID=63787 RepID=A0A7N0SZ98_KALFE
MEIIDSGCSTPYITAPSSPPRLTSATFFSQFDHNPSLKDANFGFPPTSSPPKHFPDTDFAFHFAEKFHDAPLSAEELFDHGKIKPFKPVKPPADLQTSELGTESETEQGGYVAFKTANSSPRSSPKRKAKGIDLSPSSDDVLGTRRSAKREFNYHKQEINQINESSSSSSSSSSTFKLNKARSFSPFPVSDILFDDDAKQSTTKAPQKSTSSSSFWNSFSVAKAYRKWKLKDLLFRSASEGRSTDKVTVDTALMRYAILTKKDHSNNHVRASSDGSRSGSGRRPGGVPISAHELHYTANRAASEELKKKTFLPYKQSLLGCLGYNPGRHEFPGQVGSLTRV